MSLDFGKLFHSENCSNVVLTCADRQIKAHRCVLSARSDFFAAMFRSGMLESQKGIATIKCVAPDTFVQMLLYIYSGKVEGLTVEAALELYKVSDQFGIESLIKHCRMFLMKNLSQISACKILLLADTCSDVLLKESAADFLVENWELLYTDQWNKFFEEHPSLGSQIQRMHVYKEACRIDSDMCLSSSSSFFGRQPTAALGAPSKTVNFVKNGTDTECKKAAAEEEKNSPCLENMSLDFNKLFDNEEGSDVVLKCVERQIKAHRCILSVRSDVFAAMFRSDILENQNGVVTIKDATPETLEQMLRYIYSGKVKGMTVETASELYKAATQYGVGSLKSRCVSFLSKNLSQISACDILLLADTHSDEQLEKSATDFIFENADILSKDQWRTFCVVHRPLMIKVFRKFAEQAQCRTSDGKCKYSKFYFAQVFVSSLEQFIVELNSRCDFINGVEDVLETESIKPEENNPSLEKTSLDFEKQFGDEEGSDVVLECGGRQFKAHGHILAARSDVFDLLFSSDRLKEVFTVKYTTPETLERMLRYIYSGKVEGLTVETASELYEAAREYMSLSLTEHCASFLAENLSLASACDVLLLANRYTDSTLGHSAMKFLLKDCAFFCTDQWYKLCRREPCVATDVFKMYLTWHKRSKTYRRFKPY